MAKRKVIRNTNRLFTYSPHYYTDGGDLGIFDFKDTFTKGNINTMLKSGIGSGIGSAVGNIASGAIAGGLESGAGSAISNIGGTIGGAIGAVNPVLGGIVSAASSVVGGLTNRMFGSKLNKENIAGIESVNKGMNTLMVDSSNFDTIENQWGTQNFGSDFSRSDIGKDGWFSNKAKNKFKELQKQQGIARNRALTAFENAAESADTQVDLNILGNFAAYGGPLDIWRYGGGAIGYELAKENLGIREMKALNESKLTSLPNSFSSPELNTFAKGGRIHIKPENRGKFTEYCGGKVTSECIAKGKRSSDPAVRNRATFAANASKWKHADGGPLGEENPSNYDRDNNKRMYIGGTTSEARKKYLNWDKELTQIATNLAASYGISPSLVIDRLSREGLVDYLIRANNDYLSYGDPNYPSDTFDFDDYNEPFGLLGLDNVFDTYTKGITKTKRPINMIRQVNRNERGEMVNSAETKNLYDTLELFVAELASRRNQVKKQYPNLTDEELDSATSARYNASNTYFKQLMDSGEYKTKYPINVKGINIPTPTKTDSKYIQDQVQRIDKSDILSAFERHSSYGDNLVDESIFTVGNKSYNPGLFIENYEFNSDSPLTDRFIDNYVNRNFTIPSKVKVVDDYYYEDDGKDTMYLNKKAEGGNLFTNGVTMVGNGGTHEQNPMKGVPMGIGPNGIPNLVEEGEVIFNDYVFSNRLNVPDAVREKYKLRGNKELTFADAAKQMQKESEERPNDPISKRGLESAMLRLQQEQEAVREEKQASQEGREYAHGGKMGILFDDLGEVPQRMPRAKAKRQGYDVGSSLEDYLEDPVYENADDSKSDLSWLRYAPVVGAAIGLGQNLLSKPDYSNADAILAAAEKAGTYTPVGFDPIGNYLQYNPLDRNFYINKLNAQAGATRRAIMNTSSPARNAALLAADYNAQGKLGDLARQVEEYNLAQRQAVETFNRATNMANAEMGLKAAMANQKAALNAGRTRLSGTTQAMAMRDEIAARRGASMSANLTNLFDSLGNIGIDEMNRADRDFYIKRVMGANLPLKEYRRLYGLDAAKKEAKKRGYTDNEITKLFKTNKKKRGGFTY